MARKKREKPVHEMTTDELAAKVFPKEVIEELKRIAHESDEKSEPKSKPPKKRSS